MQLKIYSPEGLKASEVKAIATIKEKLRDSWHGFASFLVNDGQGSMEIDLLLVTHDRFVLCEIKEWSGNITSSGGKWIQTFPNGNSKTHASPVHVKRGHAQRLKSLFDSELKPLWGGFYIVEYAVIMAGSATINDLPQNDKEVVFMLEDFIKINDGATEYNRILPYRDDTVFKNNYIKRPNEDSQIKILKDWFESDSAIKPRYRLAEGFLLPAKEEALFSHPKNFYYEFTAAHNETQKLKGLLRSWDFTQLGPIAMTQEIRSRIALRERRLIEYVNAEAYQIKNDYLMEPKHTATETEVEEDFIEVYGHPPRIQRLDDYLLKLKNTDERILCIRNILTPFAELHKIGVAHRDISIQRLWYNEYSKSIIISGLIAAKFPENTSHKTINDIREQLSSNSIPIPEELLGDDVDAIRLDVYLLGAIVYKVAFSEEIDKDEKSIVWKLPKNDPYEGKLNDWIKKAVDFDASDRYSSATEMLSALSLLMSSQQVLDNSDEENIMREIAGYRKNDIIPYVNWAMLPETLDNSKPGRQRYKSSNSNGDKYIVKIWQLLHAQAGEYPKNRKIYDFLKRCQKVHGSQLDIPVVVDFGISPNGLYLVQEYVEGVSLDVEINNLPRDNEGLELRLELAKKIISSIKLLHESSLAHGDLKPENILVKKSEQLEVILIDFFDLDQDGNPVYNEEYSPAVQQNARSRDIYAIYCIVDEIFSRCGGYAHSIRDEIKRALGENLQSTPFSLIPLQETLDNAVNEDNALADTITFYEGTASNVEFPLMPYSGEYFLELDERNAPEYRLFITGAKQSLTLTVLKEVDEVKIKYQKIKDIAPAEVLRIAKNRHKKNINCLITVSEGNGDNTPFLNKFFELFELNIFKNTNDEIAIEKNGEILPVAVGDVWKSIINEEFELHVRVEAASSEEVAEHKLVYVDIEEDINDFNFELNDVVRVTDGSQEYPWNFGELDLYKCEKHRLAIKKKGRKRISKGDTLQLCEQRSEISWRRRRDALDRILRNEALIPNLYTMFSSQKIAPLRLISPLPEPSQELLEIYKKKLDTSKLSAFKHILSSNQLHVIMGPPGTGKTTLLSVLLDYFARINEVNRVLLVSQSHIAVNEVAVRARKVISEVDSLLTEKVQIDFEMVRLGDSDKIADSLLDIHVDALQSQYRTAFLSDLENRLLTLCNRLALPEDFIVAAATLYRDLGSEIHIYTKLLNTPTSSQEKIKKYYDMLYKKLLAYTDTPDVVFSEKDMQHALLKELALLYEINNPLKITKLNKILYIVHQWYQRLSADSEGFAGFMAKTRQLVIGTLVGIGKAAYDIASHQYDVVIIDEAGRASASELAMAMQSAKRVILVGDHHQLPPHYEHSVIKQVASKLKINKCEVEKTDFERAFEVNNGVMLDTQYRMQKPIGDLISHVFYNGKLETGTEKEVGIEGPSPWNVEVCWIDTTGGENYEMRGGSSVSNEKEIDIICSQLKALVENNDSLRKLRKWAGEDVHCPIGIITGYARQVRELSYRFENDSWAAPIREMVKIDTIDSYQGGENRIIILSLVRHNQEHNIGFMKERARINVALSRAKNHLLIVGASEMYTYTDTWLGKIYKYILDNSIITPDNYKIMKYK